MFKTIDLKTGEGKYFVNLLATVTEDGLIVQLLGGEKPHVGAVVMTLSRNSLTNDQANSCNSYVLPRIGHKEDEIAKPLAERISCALSQPVVLVAGLHIDNATKQDIQMLLANAEVLTTDLIEQLSKI